MPATSPYDTYDPGGRVFMGLPQGTEAAFGFSGGGGGGMTRRRLGLSSSISAGGGGTRGDQARAFSSFVGVGGSRGGSMGGGTGGFDPGSRDRYLNPGDVTAETPVDPMQSYAYDRAKDYESGLASGTNEEIVRELGRARDDISVGMRAEGEAAMSRGADPSLFRGRALEAGKRDIHNLQGRLADVALDKRRGAIETLTGAAGSAAAGQRETHFGSLAARLAEQRQLLDEASAQQRFQEAPYQRMQSMMDTVMRYRGMLDPSSSGGFVGGGSRGGWGATTGSRSIYR